MKKEKKITVIGHFGGGKIFLDGQTIKTKIFCNEINYYTDWKLYKIDTFYFRKNLFIFIFQFIKNIFVSKDIIVLVSENGMKFFFPLLYFLSKYFKYRIYHNVIGASLADIAKKRKNFTKYLSSFKINWIETSIIHDKLFSMGITNVEVLNNFKRIKVVDFKEKEANFPIKLCTFSRVMKNKGIEDAIKAVKEINMKYGKIMIELDIYGQVYQGEKKWFDSILQNLPEGVTYKGFVPYDNSSEILKDYFALLFPTLFYTEGIPGTIIDAYAAGLPIIYSRWESCDDVIEDEITGIGYEFANYDKLVETLQSIILNPQKVNQLSQNCIRKAKEYLPETVVPRIITEITN